MNRSIDIPGTVMALCAVVALGWMFTRPAAPGAPESVVEIEADYRQAADGALLLHGTLDAPVIVTEFVDYECPVCQQTAPLIDSLRVTYGDSIAIVVQHLPLTSIHAQALPAAVAVECAARQNAFRRYHSALLASGDDVKAGAFIAVAEREGLDLPAFAACLTAPAEAFPRIAFGRQLATDHAVTGTPTVWVNEWHVRRHDAWNGAVRAVLEGERPES